jgi:tetratricopeptide (TPR) repeat protein
MPLRVVSVLLLLSVVSLGTGFADERVNYDDAERYLRSAIEVAESSGDSAKLAEALGELGRVRLAKGQYPEAKRLCLRAFDILKSTPSNRYLSVVLNTLSMLSNQDGDLVKAERYLKDAIRVVQAFDPHDHNIGHLLNNLGGIYYKKGDLGGAEKASRKAISFMEKEFGRDDVRLAPLLNNLAGLQISRRKWDAAASLLDRAFSLLKNSGNYIEVAYVLENMGAMHYARENLPEAETAFRRAYAIRLDVLGAGHPDLARTAFNLAGTLTTVGHFGEAERLYLDALQIYEKAFGATSGEVVSALAEMAQLLRKTNRLEAAAELEGRAASIRFDLERVVRVDQLR